jgi:hypothetical protein
MGTWERDQVLDQPGWYHEPPFDPTVGEIRRMQEFGHLAGQAYKPSRVSYKPLINSTCGDENANNNEQNDEPNRRGNGGNANAREGKGIITVEDERADPTHGLYVFENENRGGVVVDGFWKHGRLCIFDVRITDTECRTTRNQDPDKALKKCEKDKKDKHLHSCLQRWRDFTSLVYLVDGMAGRETKQAKAESTRKW